VGHTLSRRGFMTAAAGVAVADKTALLDGTPVRGTPFPSWPVVDGRDIVAAVRKIHASAPELAKA